jgi:SAM-dependent methyltransferase
VERRKWHHDASNVVARKLPAVLRTSLYSLGHRRRRRLPSVSARVTRAYRTLHRGVGRVVFDRSLNVDTARPMALADLGLEAPDRVGYEAGGWLDLARVLRSSEVGPADVFLDIGCGKGRMLLVARRYRFGRVIGVELSEELTAIARRNLTTCRLAARCRDVEVVTADALAYLIPDDVTVIYLFNPFRDAIFDAVLAGLKESVERRPRTVRLIYRNAIHHERLLSCGFRLVRLSRGLRPSREWRRRTAIRLYVLSPSAPAG